jgi:hypothetical protein
MRFGPPTGLPSRIRISGALGLGAGLAVVGVSVVVEPLGAGIVSWIVAVGSVEVPSPPPPGFATTKATTIAAATATRTPMRWFRPTASKRYATALAAVLLALPAAASANGDPPSNILLNADVYYGVQPPSAGESHRLGTTVERANKAGYRIKVALIGAADDLGNIPQYFSQPQAYADHLADGLRFAYRGDLLIVMPNGVGVAATKRAEPKKAAIVGIAAKQDPNALANAGERAVRALAKADGHPIGAPSGGSSALLIVLVLGGLLLVGGGAAAYRVRMSRGV